MNTRQLELNVILNITQAINRNIEEKELYQLFLEACMSNLDIPQFSLVIKKEDSFLAVLDKDINPDLNFTNEIIGLIKQTNDWVIQLEKQKGFEKAGIVMPVRHKKQVLGMIFIGKQDIDKYTENDFHFVKTLGNIVVMAIENKRLARKQIKQERIKKEMEIAREVQSYLIPDVLPKNDKIAMASSYVPHFLVGGDYFDYIKLTEDRFIFCIADVSGKGVPAALIMSNFQATLRTMVRQTEDLETIVKELNHQLYTNSQGQHFITFFIGLADLETNEMNYINAGHNPPVFLKKKQKEILLTEGTLLLGAFEELPFLNKGKVQIEQGDLFFSYTDGVTEVFNEEEEEYGEVRLSEFLEKNRERKLSDLHQTLIKELNVFRGTKEYFDDLTMLSLRIK